MSRLALFMTIRSKTVPSRAGGVGEDVANPNPSECRTCRITASASSGERLRSRGGAMDDPGCWGMTVASPELRPRRTPSVGGVPAAGAANCYLEPCPGQRASRYKSMRTRASGVGAGFSRLRILQADGLCCRPALENAVSPIARHGLCYREPCFRHTLPQWRSLC